MSRGQRGAVTAEIALGLPLLISLTVGLVWLLTIGIAQALVVDAAREAARSAARGDPTSDAVGLALHVDPHATVQVHVVEGEVVASVSDQVAPPGGLLGFLPSARVHAQAVTAAEVGP